MSKALSILQVNVRKRAPVQQSLMNNDTLKDYGRVGGRRAVREAGGRQGYYEPGVAKQLDGDDAYTVARCALPHPEHALGEERH